MFAQFAGAAFRAFLMALLIAMPSLMLANADSYTAQVVMIVALIFAGLTFLEYSSEFPSLLEFRFAPPVNRLRFVSVALTVFMLTAVARNGLNPNALTQLMGALSNMLGWLTDVPFSPVHLVVLMMPENTDWADIEKIRGTAALAYTMSLGSVAALGFVMWWRNWPHGNGAFNVWINLPLFDPTSGDVVERLTREARINVSLGFILPFLAPAILKLAGSHVDPARLCEPQTLIWAATLWAFIPTSLIIRGLAMQRVAGLIGEKRRRAYEAEALQPT